jgi:nitrogen fixation/metabolism regulation signal transduction histidine kinase
VSTTSSRATRWAIIVSAVAVAGAALVLAFMLALATDTGAVLERHDGWLLVVNIALAALLGLVILIAAVRLAFRMRSGKFGSQLLLKLAGIFALVGVVPGLLIYTVSYQFVSRSIESWFDVRVEGALDAGLVLGRSTLDAQVTDLTQKTRNAAERLAELSTVAQPLTLERLREQLGASDVSLVSGNGQILVAASGVGLSLAPERPSLALLRQARAQRVVGQLEGLDDDTTTSATTPPASASPAAPAGTSAPKARAIAYIPSADIAIGSEDRYLVVTQRISPALAANALAVQAAYRDYQQRALARAGLRSMYIGTLTLALILAVFGAVLLAAALGHQLARPLLLLAEGVKQVAQGDLTPKPVFASRDELGGLTRSFADMTGQLSDARALVDRSVAQLERARTRLQTLLDNLTAGVIVFDRDAKVDTVNPGATRILREPMGLYVGKRLTDVLGLAGFADAVERRFALHRAAPEAGERDQWQDSFELPADHDHDRPALTLLVRGAALPLDARLLVFDDITDIVSAQRQIAWSEVARRLAHEIKNPLTPIQLSAERLQMKLQPKLDEPEQAILDRSVGTIVTQVQAMKQLVNEFRDYARLPSAQLEPLDLNALVADVLALYGAEQDNARLVSERAPRLPRIVGDATQLRQVVHNLVQNALDAVADQPDGEVRVVTEATRGEGDARAVRLEVVDNGPGFSDKVLGREFEPYVTTKPKGTGLGLAVVKKIADEHGARVRVANLRDSAAAGSGQRGAQVSLSFSRLVPDEEPHADQPPPHTPAHRTPSRRYL